MSAPIVLIHGFATSAARTWGETGWLDILGDSGRDLLPLDLPGHGRAPNCREAEGFANLEQDTLDRLPAVPVDAIGFSMGARLLLTMGAMQPDRFKRLVVAGVGRNLFEFDPARRDAIAAAIAGELDPENPEARFFHELAEAPDVDRASLVAMMSSERPLLDADVLAKITCPVLVVIGDNDFAGPADQLGDALPNASHKVLRNVDHFATPRDFSFIDATLDFLEAFPS